jgi:hypothetical protein
MERFDRGRALKNAWTRAIVLSCAFMIPLLFSSNTHALTVDPVIDTVISVAKLTESENKSTADDRRGSSRSNASTTQSPANKAPDTATQLPVPVQAPSEAAIVAEPIEQLPTIDAIGMPPRTVYIYRPVSAVTVSHAVLGTTATDTVAPLQASDHGWKFFGVAWYWWLLGGLIIYVAIRHVTLLQYRQTVRQEFIVS